MTLDSDLFVLPPELSRRYLIQELLGRGGMGAVFRALDRELDRDVAFKVMLGALDDDSIKRVVREARALAQLSSPHIVRVYDAGQADGRPYLTMELVRGPSLANVISRGPLPFKQVVSMLRALCSGLAEVHGAGLVHRDLKPQNIILRSEDDFVLIDFGLAFAPDQTRMTENGAVMGTPRYLAPELLRGEDVAPPADLFGLGLIGLEALAGRPVLSFDGSSDALGQVVAALSSGSYLDMARRIAEPYGALGSVLLKLVEREPMDRPAGARVVLTMLDKVAPTTVLEVARDQPTEPAEPPPPRQLPLPPPEKPSGPRLNVLPLVLIVLVCAVGGFFALRRGKSSVPEPSASSGSAAASASATTAEGPAAWVAEAEKALAEKPPLVRRIEIMDELVRRISEAPPPATRLPVSDVMSRTLYEDLIRRISPFDRRARKIVDGFDRWRELAKNNLLDDPAQTIESRFAKQREAALSDEERAELRRMARVALGGISDHGGALAVLRPRFSYEIYLATVSSETILFAEHFGIVNPREADTRLDAWRRRSPESVATAVSMFLDRRRERRVSRQETHRLMLRAVRAVLDAVSADAHAFDQLFEATWYLRFMADIGDTFLWFAVRTPDAVTTFKSLFGAMPPRDRVDAFTRSHCEELDAKLKQIEALPAGTL